MSLYHIDFFQPFFYFLKVTDRRTDQQTYLPVEMQFYISVMFLGLPDDMLEEKPSFLQFKKTALPTVRPTNGLTDRPSCRNARTHLKVVFSRYMQGGAQTKNCTPSFFKFICISIHVIVSIYLSYIYFLNIFHQPFHFLVLY